MSIAEIPLPESQTRFPLRPTLEGIVQQAEKLYLDGYITYPRTETSTSFLLQAASVGSRERDQLSSNSQLRYEAEVFFLTLITA